MCTNPLCEHMEELKQRLHEIARGQLVVLRLFSCVITIHKILLLPDFSRNLFYFKIVFERKGNLQSCF